MKRSIFNKYGPIVKEDDFRRAFVTLVRYTYFIDCFVKMKFV